MQGLTNIHAFIEEGTELNSFQVFMFLFFFVCLCFICQEKAITTQPTQSNILF